MTHRFLVEAGVWLGEGTVELSGSPEELKFYCRWTIEGEKPIRAIQEVQIEGVEETMRNFYTFTPGEEMAVELTNENFDSVGGTGLIDDEVIAWEFHGPLEGFEVYKRESPVRYHLRAEYTSEEGLRTKIEGAIWRKD